MKKKLRLKKECLIKWFGQNRNYPKQTFPLPRTAGKNKGFNKGTGLRKFAKQCISQYDFDE